MAKQNKSTGNKSFDKRYRQARQKARRRHLKWRHERKMNTHNEQN